MKPKAHLLVVEDKALIYKRLKMILKEHNYSVGAYAPSVAEAIGQINKKRPDVVLLDIDLQGEHKGTYLGELLSKEYHIPFIYVTEYDDDQTFYESLQTKHNDFVSKKEISLLENEEKPLVISTKPHLDFTRLIRSIQTVLESKKEPTKSILKEAILAYVDYPKNNKNLGNTDVSQVPISYKDIAFFTTNTEIIDAQKTAERKKDIFVKLDRNNTRLCTWEGKSYIISDNLSPICKILPYYFVRISEDYIVNINDEILQGRINGRRLKIRENVFTISDTYKAEVDKRFDILYQKMR